MATAAHFTVGLVGRPNSGKTTLFNALTGERRWVGNWPGVTVEGVHGSFEHDGRCIEIVDLPGAYTLTASRSLDEQVAAEFLAARRCDVVVNVVDAATLERSLYLSAQVLESQAADPEDPPAAERGVPVVVALSRIDRARADGIAIDADTLSRTLGCPVVPLAAAGGEGLEALKHAVLAAAAAKVPPPTPPYAPELRALLRRAAAERGAPGPGGRWAAIRTMEEAGDEAAHADALALGAARHAFAAQAVHAAVTRVVPPRRAVSERIDDVLLHRWWGLGAFLLAMYLMFLWTIHFGGAFVDAFDGVAGALFENGGAALAAGLGLPDWLVLAVEGLGRGIRTVAAFVPIVAFLYVFLSVLEESGYMARAAVLMDRFMGAVGLPGKAFVPLVVGLGCNVPAVMAARTLDDEEDRKVVIAMTPFVSCSARLPVYVLFAAAFFPDHGQNVVFSLYVIGLAVAVLTGFVLKRTLFAGEAAPLLLELPPYHLPGLAPVLRRTADRVVSFILDAGKVVVPVVMVLTVLNAVTTDGRISREGGADSLLAAAARSVTPVLAPIGIEEDNWPATVGLFTGLFAKEAVVGTLRALYAGENPEAPPATAGEIGGAVLAALATVPERFRGMAGALLDPLDMAGGGELAAEAAGGAMLGTMQSRFDGGAGAFAYLVFVLLYAPCVATIAAIRREAGGAWTVFTLMWATAMGYTFATLAYQLASFAEHPLSSAAWIAAVASASAAVVVAMRRQGRRLTLAPGAGHGCRPGPACGRCSAGHPPGSSRPA